MYRYLSEINWIRHPFLTDVKCPLYAKSSWTQPQILMVFIYNLLVNPNCGTVEVSSANSTGPSLFYVKKLRLRITYLRSSSSHQTEQAFKFQSLNSRAYVLFLTLRFHQGCFSDTLARWFLWFQALDRVLLFSFWK